MSAARVAIVGAGGHARVVIDIVERVGRHAILGVFDDDPDTWGRRVGEHRVIGGVGELLATWRGGEDAAIVAIGDNHARHKIVRRLLDRGVPLATAVHPAAVLARDVTVGPGTVAVALAVVNPGAVLGAAVIINTAASVGHDAVVGDGASVGPGARLCGRARVGDLALVGAGAVVVPGRTIGRSARVGAGAVVVHDVPADTTVVGVPARPLPRHRAPRDRRPATLTDRLHTEGGG